MHNYSGSDSFPANLSLIDDSDSPVATNFNPGHEGNADRTRWLKNRLGWDRTRDFASSTTFTVPLGVDYLDCEGCGGGGGGAGGKSRSLSGAGSSYGGGGGGGGARKHSKRVAVTAGEVLDIHCGARGTAGGIGADGGNGEATTIKRSGTTIAEWAGAHGGCAQSYVGSTTNFTWAYGGPPVADVGLATAMKTGYAAFATLPGAIGGIMRTSTPGEGGISTDAVVALSQNGNGSPEGFLGGAAGGNGIEDAGTYGGGGGGGGGAGGYGPGMPGGGGGNGTSGGAGISASSGSEGPFTNSGCGGGGGGGGGGGTSAGSGAQGGAGDAGFLRINWVEVGSR